MEVLAMDGQCKILGHDSILINDFNGSGLQFSTKLMQWFIPVKFGAELLLDVWQPKIGYAGKLTMSPLVQAKIEATGLVLVSLPFWCSL